MYIGERTYLCSFECTLYVCTYAYSTVFVYDVCVYVYIATL
jgi:hypothetical protein